MRKDKWKRLRNKQFVWFDVLFSLWLVSLLGLLLFYMVFRNTDIISCMVVVSVSGAVFFGMLYPIIREPMKISKRIEKFIRRNKLYQSHSVREQGLLGEWKIERMDYYPIVEYRKSEQDNAFYIKIRRDGSPYAERFRDMEEPLARMFKTVCIDTIVERGYLTYIFELREQNRIRIKSCKDIPQAGKNEIAFSRDMVWNWKKCPHFLLVGNTGSGKTQLAQYMISCLIKRGIRVIYCDPKNDYEMRYFAENCGAVYVSEENEIAKAVRETEEEMRKRGKELDNLGMQETDFQPLYLVFDELIAFSKIAEKKTYEETAKRIASIVVMGRSKRVYAGLILQRPDTAFIEGAVRDNLGCRICMGQMSDTAYKMAFGSDFADVKNFRREIGSGLIFRQGVDVKPREFLAPYIEKGALIRE